MSSLVALDVADIAKSVAKGAVTHATSLWVSSDTKAHAYVLGENAAVPAGTEDPFEGSDLIVLLDGAGNYDAFFAPGVKGSDLLIGAPVAQGAASEFIPKPEEDERPGA